MNEIIFKQSRMGMKMYMSAIMFITTVQWMVLDMYLPALPVLKEQLHTSEALLNLSLNAGIYSCAVGMIIGGMLSDKYGRKSIMIVSLLLAASASFMGAASNDVITLSLMRGLAGLGSGCIQAVTAAIIRDSYEGSKFQKVMALQQAFGAAGPIISPAIGSFFVSSLSWRWIFITLGIATFLGLIPILFSDETWPKEKRIVTNMKETLGEMVNLTKEIQFIVFLMILFALTMPLWSYLGVSSYVYYNEFHVSNLVYSILYATGCAISLIASFMFMGLSNKIALGKIIFLCAGLLLLSGVALEAFGSRNSIAFLMCLVPLMLCEGMMRPLGMVVALDEHPDKAGSASAITSFGMNIAGGIGTSIATLSWSSFVTGLSVISFGCAIVSVPFFVVIIEKAYYKERLWEEN